MPPKSSSKKKVTVLWYYCEDCGVNISFAERETHEKVCPIPENESVQTNSALEYIRAGYLCTVTAERRSFPIEELKGLPERCIAQLVGISEGAMRLARFQIGQQVKIESLNAPETPPLVRLAWPLPDKFLTTLLVSEEDFLVNWTTIKGHRLKVSALSCDFITPARVIHLELQPNQSYIWSDMQIKSMEKLLRLEFRDYIFTVGSTINTDFFNRSVNLIITSWQSWNEMANNNECALEKEFANMSLNSENIFFQIVYGTCLKIKLKNVTNESDGESIETSTTVVKIGGLNDQQRIIKDSLDFALGFRVVPKGIQISRAILIYGPSGCGKSLLCDSMSHYLQNLRKDLKTHIIRINACELFSKYLGESEKNLQAQFSKAFANYPEPSLIIIDDVHHVCPKKQSNDVTKRVAAAFSALLETVSSSKREAQRIFILATTSQIDEMDPSVRRCGRFDCEVEVGAPTPKDRAEILEALLQNVKHNLSTEEIDNIAKVTHGFVGADIANLINTAALNVLKAKSKESSDDDTLSDEYIQSALLHVKPSAMREVLIECPNILWTDIGGQQELKLKLKQAIEWPLQHPEKFQRLGIKPPRGILMFGPPGCSKTLVAKALATESKLNFLSIKGPELFSMWVGESERAVREVFRKARQVSPAIVFFDEIDAIGSERAESGSGSGSSVKERVLTQLLTELDGVEALNDVTVVAATNRPDMIDKALLRPGRIDRIIYVGLPDVSSRQEIFQIHLRKMPLGNDVKVDELAKRTEGYSGAEIQAICHEAALKALEESFDSEYVTQSHFEYALEIVQPRTSPELLRLYDDYLKQS